MPKGQEENQNLICEQWEQDNRCGERDNSTERDEVEGECGGHQTFREVMRVVRMLNGDVGAKMIQKKNRKNVSKVDFISNRWVGHWG